MSLILRTPWTRQPQVAGASVDRERLGALGVCGGFVAIPGKWPPRNIVNATDPIPSAGALGVNVGMVPTTDIKGIAGNWFADGSNRYLRYTLGAPSATNFSFAARLRITDAANIIPVRSSDTADGTTIAVWNNGGAFDMRINGTDYSAAGSFSLNSWYDIQIVGSGSACRLYVDGNLTINGAAASAGTLDANFCLGATSGGASTAPNGSVDILYCVWANRAWNDGEREGVRNNPWQLFAPIERRIWVPVSAAGGGVDLVIADATHAHAADAPTLTTTWLLTVADATHGHAADAPTLSTEWLLAPADALHGHAADNLTLEPSGSANLAPADATHGHTADAITLTTASLLAVQDALHAHAAEAATLSTEWLLAPADATHAHAADNLTLSDAPALLIAEALHAHTADGVTMTVDAWLVLADATHGHLADNVVLFVPGGTTVREVLRLSSPLRRAVAGSSALTRTVALASDIDAESTTP